MQHLGKLRLNNNSSAANLGKQDKNNSNAYVCPFFGSFEDAWAFTLTGNDLKDQHLILLSNELLRESPTQIRYTIAHEIGHVILRHRNSILEQQSKAEIRKQEKEADEFASKFVDLA